MLYKTAFLLWILGFLLKIIKKIFPFATLNLLSIRRLRISHFENSKKNEKLWLKCYLKKTFRYKISKGRFVVRSLKKHLNNIDIF